MRTSNNHVLLFNHPHYHQFNLRPGQALFRYDHVADGKLVGTFTGVVDGDQLECGFSAPFGGPDLVRSDENAGRVRSFVMGVLSTAAAQGIRRVRIRTRPDYFSSNESIIVFSLLNLGFTPERCELSLGLTVPPSFSLEQYLTGLKSSQRRELRHGLAANLSFIALAGEADWEAAYRVIEKNRARRNVTLKLSLTFILDLRRLFPDRIRLYGLRLDQVIVAAALVYRVLPDVDYVVAWGDDHDHRHLAPVNVMAYHLIDEAIRSGVRLVDLGISSVDGIPDDGLIDFKRHIGARPGLRLDLVATLGQEAQLDCSGSRG